MNKKLILLISSLIISILVTGCIYSSTIKKHKNITNKSIQNVQVSSTTNTNDNISYYFSNEGLKPDKQLINLINVSTKTLDIAIYSLTKKDIVDAIISAKKRGVFVRLMSDRTESKSKSQSIELQQIKQTGIQVKINTHLGLLHDKYTIVDGKIIATGSYNYTNNANDENDENMIIIRDNNIARAYENNFNSMWNDNTRFSDY